MGIKTLHDQLLQHKLYFESGKKINLAESDFIQTAKPIEKSRAGLANWKNMSQQHISNNNMTAKSRQNLHNKSLESARSSRTMNLGI